MTRTDADKQRMIDRLTEAARPSQDGTLYVRASTACRIIGVGCGQRTKWEASGNIQAVRFRVTPRQGAPMGIVVAWPLDQVIACTLAYKPLCERRWSQADESRLLSYLGRYRLAVIAQKLGRSPRAVCKRAYLLGVNARTNAGNLTTGEVAKICHRSRQAVQLWCLREGLAFQRLPGARGEKLIKPERLAAFLKSRPGIWRGLPESSRRQVERMSQRVVLPARPASEARSPRIYKRVAA